MARVGHTYLFTPAPPPENASVDEVKRWAYDQFINLQQFLIEATSGVCEVRYAAPAHPRPGQIRFADGTSWNPGLGAGFYGYTVAGAWVKLS
jgi:hypothetical protein